MTSEPVTLHVLMFVQGHHSQHCTEFVLTRRHGDPGVSREVLSRITYPVRGVQRGFTEEVAKEMDVFLSGHLHVHTRLERPRLLRRHQKGGSMSAFIVDKAQIDAIVQAMLTYELIVPEDADDTGRMLWNENLASIHARYPDTITSWDYPGPIDFTPCDVDDYQSCEHERWDRSEAKALNGRLMQVCAERKTEFIQRFGSVDREQLRRVGVWSVDSREIYVHAQQARALNLTKEPV